MTSTTAETPGIPIRGFVGLAGAAALLMALYGAYIAFGKAWAFVGFEAVAFFAGVGALLFAAGKVRHAPAMALACIAGCLFVAGVLGYVPIRNGLQGLPVKPLYWAAGHVAIAGLLVAVAVVISVLHNTAAARTLFRAVLWVLPLVLVAGWYKFAGLAPLLSGQSGVLEVLRIVGMFVIAVACGVSLCAFVHCAIRAFEIAFPEPNEA